MDSHFHPVSWVVILMLCFSSSCVDCSGDKTRLENKVRDLESRVHQLETHRR